jgi:DNA-binding NarL/FixJ family response regulator
VIRVLVADDEANIRALFRAMLELEDGFEVVGEAGDGEQVVAMAASQQPDAVVLDLSMPRMDGYDAMPGIRRESPTTKIVVVTARSAVTAADRAYLSGASAFLEKPDAVDSLASVLSRLVA